MKEKKLSETPTATYCGLGGTLGIAIIYIFKPPFLSSAAHDPARLLEFLLIWWLLSFIGGLVTGQLKLTGRKSDQDKDTKGGINNVRA